MRRALALLTLLLLAGCTTRERSNPLDPSNPGTAGRPAGFVALAGNAQVFLEWDLANPALGISYVLERQVEGSPDFLPLTPTLRPDVRTFLDLQVANGVTYRYRLHYLSAGTLSAPAEDAATPSRMIPWAVDVGRRSLLRLTADGRHITLEEPGFTDPAQVAVDPVLHNVWVVDPDAGRVVVYVPSLGARVNVSDFQDPEYVAVDPLSGSAWVSDFLGNTVRHLLPSGGPGTPSSLGVLNRPLGLDVDPHNGILWVCERQGNLVRRYAADGTPLGSAVLASPSRVAVDSSNGEAWVTSFNSRLLVHYAADGTPLDSVTAFQGPVGVRVDTYRARVWVTDPVAGQVIAFRRDGTEEFRTRGLPGAVELAVDPGSGEAWVALTGTVARIAPTGALILTTSGLSAPAGIALDRFAR
jgi:DNA-binding beta-propeller fold protein YncE